MALKLSASTLVTVRWNATLGRHYLHDEKLVACLTCPAPMSEAFAPYTAECKASDHVKHREVETKVQEDAPEEAKAVPAVYRLAIKELRALGMNLGGGDFLIPTQKRKDLDSAIAKCHTALAIAQATWNVCSAHLSFRVLEIDPATSNEENLKSIRNDISEMLDKINLAVTSGDTSQIRKVLRETKDMAALVEGQAKVEVAKLGAFADQVAKRLLDAADMGQEHVDLVVRDAKSGAERFKIIFDDLISETGQAAAEVTPSAA